MLNEVKIKYVVDSSELAKATEAFDKLTAEEKAANAALDKFQTNLRETGEEGKAGLGPATSSAIKFGAAIGKSQSQVRAFTNSLREAGTAAVTAGNKAQAGFAGAEAQLRKNKAAAEAFQRSLQQIKPPPAMAGGAPGKGQDLLGQLMGMAKLGGKIFIAKQVYDTAMSVAKAGMEVEALNAQFKFLTGSAEGAKNQMEDIKSTANAFGVNITSAAKAYKDFAIASTLAGQSLDNTNQQFRAVVMASRAMGLSGEQMEGAFRAMQQALSKGVLSAEELRGQLSEHIPGAFSMTANAIGVTERELGKMIESGNVLSADVMPLLALQMEQTFGPQVLENANSLGSSFERFINSWSESFKKLGVISGPILKYIFDSVTYWIELADKLEDLFSLTSDERTQKQVKQIQENIKYNTELEIAQYQAQIAGEKGLQAAQVTRAEAAQRALKATEGSYNALKSAAEGYGRADPMTQQNLEYANIRKSALEAEVKRQADADALAQKVRDDAAKGNAEREKKAAKAKAEAAERERLAKIKKDFESQKQSIEDAKKIAELELEQSKKNAATKAEELLRIEEKYLSDLIALRQKFGKKEPKLRTEFQKGMAIEQTQLKGVRGEIPFAAVDVRIKEFGKLAETEEKAIQESYQLELKAAQSRMNIRDMEVDAMEASEQKKRKIKIENEIAANNETMAINEKFMNQGNEEALNAVDAQNAELIARNKALQKELTAIDKEGNQERADLVSAWGQHIQSVFNGAMNLYQQNLAAELEATQARYTEEERLAGANKQKLTEIRERQRNEEKEIRRKQFEAQKVAAVADVVFQTAPIIAKYGAQIFTIPLALAAVAAQAAQIAFILAQPVPEFAQGTRGRRHKGGPAIVGELGVEKVVTESGKVYYTPPTATLVDLPRGAQVIPNHELRKELFYASSMNRNASMASVDPVVTGISEIGGILKSLPIHQINMDERGFEKYIRTPKRATKILNSRFPGN
jgi:tape measure domain-containing protein